MNYNLQNLLFNLHEQTMLNIDSAYKAVEILNREGDLSVEYVGCDEESKNRFVASSCGYSCFGGTALEATLKLFWARYPNIGLNFFHKNDGGWI